MWWIKRHAAMVGLLFGTLLLLALPAPARGQAADAASQARTSCAPQTPAPPLSPSDAHLLSCPPVLVDCAERPLVSATLIYALLDRGPEYRPTGRKYRDRMDLMYDLDTGDFVEGARSSGYSWHRKPQLLCSYQGSRFQVPLDIPKSARVCNRKGYCD